MNGAIIICGGRRDPFVGWQLFDEFRRSFQ
jgi:hypothetical protein